jgi:hypothetical protein
MATSFAEGKLHPSRRRSGTILCWNWQMLAAFGLKSALFNGAPEEIRTPDPQIRRLLRGLCF